MALPGMIMELAAPSSATRKRAMARSGRAVTGSGDGTKMFIAWLARQFFRLECHSVLSRNEIDLCDQ